KKDMTVGGGQASICALSMVEPMEDEEEVLDADDKARAHVRRESGELDLDALPARRQVGSPDPRLPRAQDGPLCLVIAAVG
ncbi:MAG: hypothetical protein ACE5JI_21185, partial [Acidobacteriota bacterium]